MKRSRIGLTVACAVALTIVLVGCREEEQNRVLMFDKGSYAGKPDTPLSAATRLALRERIGHQIGPDTVGGPSYGSGGNAGGGSGRALDVRPPGVKLDTLRSRGENQRFN
ncbi:MAG: hypothetical protein HQ514_04500 [Rhodospirillales bacterium]|nr:hypothetical protein [Rhodospirillales bacterium]